MCLAIVTYFWSFDHFDPQEGGFKVFFLLISNTVTKNPKNMLMNFEHTSLMGLGWVKMIYLSYFELFLTDFGVLIMLTPKEVPSK